MRRSISTGQYVQVTSDKKDSDYYTIEGLDTNSGTDVLTSLGFDKETAKEILEMEISAPKKGLEADVVKVGGGVALIKDIVGKHYLVETTSLKAAKKMQEIKYLLMMNKERIEEYSTLDEIKARIKDLIDTKVADFNTTFRIYELAGIKEVKVEVGIFLG